MSAQTMEALRVADDVRLRQAALLAQVHDTRSMRLSLQLLADVLEQRRHEFSKRFTVLDALHRVYKLQATTARELLAAARVSPTRSVRDLTVRETGALAAALRTHANRIRSR